MLSLDQDLTLTNLHGINKYVVEEEALSSRTINIDDPNKPGRNGASSFKVCLETYIPQIVKSMPE